MVLNTMDVYKAHLALEVVFNVVNIALGVLTFTSRRRQNSQERRRGVKWLYAAIVFYAM